MFDIFYSYLKLGFQHIADTESLDHILFVITLCAVYQVAEWKKIAWVITAFTLGHSITLILAALHIIVPNRYWIELLIPVTILISGLFNLIADKVPLPSGRLYVKYTLALFFGLIHGMGFSSYFSDIMGDASAVVFPLFSFNVGIELGQFFVILIFYLITYFALRLFRISFSAITRLFSILGVLVALYLIFKRI